MQNLRFTITGESTGLAIVEEELRGVYKLHKFKKLIFIRIGRNSIDLFPNSFTHYPDLIDHRELMGSWMDVDNKDVYSVDFSTRKPVPGKDYYLIFGGSTFILDVSTVPGTPCHCQY